MVASKRTPQSVIQAPLRKVRFWEPRIEMRKSSDGVYYIRQTEALPTPPRRIADQLRHWGEKTPDAVLLADRGPDGEWRKLTYRAAVENGERLGEFLLGHGISPEHPLLILSGNDLEHAQLALACVLAGVPYSPISEAYSLVSSDYAKLKDIATLLEPGMVFAADGERFGDVIDTVFPDAPVLVTRNPKRAGTMLFGDALQTQATARIAAAAEAVGPDTIVKFLFTSGSTGSPKAVINTNRMICANQMMVRDCYAFMQDEPPVVLDWAPWNHTAGGNKVFFMVLFNGGTLYIDDGSPTPAGMSKTIRNLKEIAPTWYFNVPKGYEELVPAFEADPELRANFFSRVKMLMYAGAGLAQHTQDALQRLAVETTGERVLIAAGLGATETGPFCLMCTWEAREAGNVGLPSKGVEMKLKPVGDKLELWVRSPSVTPGYWKEPELTAKAFDADGFYNLGDALRFEDESDPMKGLYFDGRTAENFKLRTGTWVAVGALRAKMINHFEGLIRDVALTGLNEEFIGGLVFADARQCGQIAGDDSFSGAALVEHPKVRAAFAEKLKSFAAVSTGSSMRVRRIILQAEPPNIDKGEATDKGSINQRAVISHRAADVAEIYAGSPRVIDIKD